MAKTSNEKISSGLEQMFYAGMVISAFYLAQYLINQLSGNVLGAFMSVAFYVSICTLLLDTFMTQPIFRHFFPQVQAQDNNLEIFLMKLVIFLGAGFVIFQGALFFQCYFLAAVLELALYAKLFDGIFQTSLFLAQIQSKSAQSAQSRAVTLVLYMIAVRVFLAVQMALFGPSSDNIFIYLGNPLIIQAELDKAHQSIIGSFYLLLNYRAFDSGLLPPKHLNYAGFLDGAIELSHGILEKGLTLIYSSRVATHETHRTLLRHRAVPVFA